MPNITHAGVWYEPGKEPPGWVPPVPAPDEPEAAADGEPEAAAVPPRTPPRRAPAPDGA